MKVKQLLALVLVSLIMISGVNAVYASDYKTIVTAKPTNQKITVDGVPTSFRAYNIEGYNYFMLRDIAHIFKGTRAQFEVAWDQDKFAINLQTGKKYTGEAVGFDMEAPHVEISAIKSKARIYKNGKEALLLGYTIEGYTYFKLRDLGNELGFGVDWDNENQTVVLLSDKKQDMREDMLALINEAREKEGLNPLVLDDKLNEMAEFKSADMSELNAMTHNGSYGTFEDLLSLFNISYRTAGENILQGGLSAEEMFRCWWNSPGHRANMMNPQFRKIGIGFCDYWATQHFTD